MTGGSGPVRSRPFCHVSFPAAHSLAFCTLSSTLGLPLSVGILRSVDRFALIIRGTLGFPISPLNTLIAKLISYSPGGTI